MIENNIKRHFHGIPICTFDPYFSKLGYLANHPSEYKEPPYESPGTKKIGCYGEHVHRELEAHYVVSGEYHAIINGRERIVRAGELLIINPFDTHSGYYIVSDEPLYYYFTIFDLAFFSQALPPHFGKTVGEIHSGKARFRESISQSELDIIAKAQSEPLEEIFKNLHDYYSVGRSLKLVSEVYRLLALLLNFCVSDEKCEKQSKDFEFICLVSEIIDAEYATKLTAANLSERLSYSESHFCRRFRECFGMTFTDYLCRYRLRRAANYSFGDKQSLTDIATDVGFNDYAYFSRSFAKYYGMPPMKYFRSKK